MSARVSRARKRLLDRLSPRAGTGHRSRHRNREPHRRRAKTIIDAGPSPRGEPVCFRSEIRSKPDCRGTRKFDDHEVDRRHRRLRVSLRRAGPRGRFRRRRTSRPPRPQSQRVLQVARLADPHPDGWRSRARDPDVWKDKAALKRLAEEIVDSEKVPAADFRVPVLLLLAERFRKAAVDPFPMLKRVHRTQPNDFWLNLWLGQYDRDTRRDRARSRPEIGTRNGAVSERSGRGSPEGTCGGRRRTRLEPAQRAGSRWMDLPFPPPRSRGDDPSRSTDETEIDRTNIRQSNVVVLPAPVVRRLSELTCADSRHYRPRAIVVPRLAKTHTATADQHAVPTVRAIMYPITVRVAPSPATIRFIKPCR
jgi:hypothetical protein